MPRKFSEKQSMFTEQPPSEAAPQLPSPEELRPEKWYELMNERSDLLAKLSAKGEVWPAKTTEPIRGYDAVARIKRRLLKLDKQLGEIQIKPAGQDSLAEFYQTVSEDEKFNLVLETLRRLRVGQTEAAAQEYAIISEGKRSKQGLTKADREALQEVRQEQHELAQQESLLENSDATAVFYRMAVLEIYRQSLQDKNFVETPSRRRLADRIKFHIENSEPILLEGETGTGKTELALNLCRQLYNGREPEFISGSPDVRASDLLVKQGLRASETTSKQKREDLAKEISEHVQQYQRANPQATDMDIARENDNYARIVAASAGVTPETYFVYGPLVKAMEEGLPLIVDEANLIEPRLRMVLKRIYNAKPGDKIPIAGDGQAQVAPGFDLIFTANLKSEKHTERFDFDEAEKRTMINSTIHVDYLPKEELYDLMLAKSADSQGEAPLSRTEAETTLKNFCDAVADIQIAYRDRPSEAYAPKDARGRQHEFKEGVLDPGAALRMLNGLEAKSPDEPLADFLNRSILNYASNRNYNPKDRELIAKIFLSKGFLQNINAKQLEIPGLEENALEPFRARAEKEEVAGQQKQIKELNRRQLAELDPYGLRKIANQQIGEGFLNLAEETADGENNEHELVGEFAFIVRNAVNPYVEALKEGGITDPDLVKEKKDIEIDLNELLEHDRSAYEAAGLTGWLANMPLNVSDYSRIMWSNGKKQMDVLKSRVEQGEIPIFMPGRLAQIGGLMEAVNSLRPEWIKDGEDKGVDSAYHWDYIDKLIAIMKEIAEKMSGGHRLTAKEIEEIKKQVDPLVEDKVNGANQLIESVKAIPEMQYIFTAKPSQKNNDRTRNKDLAAQIAELAGIKAENPQVNLQIMSIGEYLALQNRFTNRLRELSNLQDLSPLDDYNRSDGTFTRFIDLPVSAGGFVPFGRWCSVIARLELDGCDGWACSCGGFRVSVRV